MTEVFLFGGCHMQAEHFHVAALYPTAHVSQTVKYFAVILSD